jgi:hypothetical protein
MSNERPQSVRSALIWAAYIAHRDVVDRADFLLLAQASFDLLQLPDGREETLAALTKK